MKRKTQNRGLALLTAIIIMVFLVTIVVVLDRVGRMSMIKTMNHRSVINARMASESGLNYIKYHIRECTMNNCDDGDDALTGLRQYFTSKSIGYTSTTIDGKSAIVLNSIDIPGMDGSFVATIQSEGSGATSPAITMKVVGTCQETNRTLNLSFETAMGSRSPLFDFGFSSAGTLTMKGDCFMKGANDPSESNIYMSNLTDNNIVTLSGTSLIEGKIFACGDDAYVDYGGSASVGGATGADIASNVYQGVDQYPMPEIDITPFTDAVSSFTDITSSACNDTEYTNIRIKANTNPEFSQDTVINGVIYIESPNVVTFKSHVTVTGVIVTDTGTGDSSNCYIDFKSNVVLQSPLNLPDTAEFADLRDASLDGTTLLAEGFTVGFKGVSQVIGGTMAADSFSFKGNRDTTVKGSIICYGDSEVDTELKGEQHFWFDMSSMPDTPPGFVGGGQTVIVPMASTYESTPEGHF